MPKTKTLRTRQAGPVREAMLRTWMNNKDSDRARAVKRKATSEIQQRYNDISSWKKLELMLAANYRPGDLVTTLTYDSKHYPASRDAVKAHIKYFMKKLKPHYKERTVEFVMFWAIENVHGEGRWHVHLILRATGKGDYDAIRSAWIYGDQIDIIKLRVDRDKNYGTLARYYAKEAREKVGLRAWSHTTNARKPEEERERVDSDYKVQVPEGATVLDVVDIVTEYGSYYYIKYLMPGFQYEKPKRVKRKE